MLGEPLGLLTLLVLYGRMPTWMLEFLPAYKATRVVTEVFCERCAAAAAAFF